MEPKFATVIKIDMIREVTASEWGKTFVEDLLLRAAKEVHESDTPGTSVTFGVDFTVAADIEGRALLVSTPGEIETAIVLRLPMN